jgi:cytochrome bd-type quinol oxidase subunit 2
MNPSSTQHLLNHTWFGLIGLMLVLYVVTDGFDLGVGILTLLRGRDSDRDLMIQSIGHVWDANETWLVVLGGALVGAFPDAYAMILSAARPSSFAILHVPARHCGTGSSVSAACSRRSARASCSARC